MPYTGLFQIAAVVTGFGCNGTDYKFTHGSSEPTKSAVVGMLAAADGRAKTDSIDDLNALQIGTMTINPGVIHTRFNTTTGGRKLEDGIRENPLIRKKAYFHASNESDNGDWLVRHIVGFQSTDESFVRHLLKKLTVPVFPVFVGRANCRPAEPMPLGYVEGTLFDAFKLIQVNGQATIEVVPSLQIKHKRRVMDVLDGFSTRRVLSRMVVSQNI